MKKILAIALMLVLLCAGIADSENALVSGSAGLSADCAYMDADGDGVCDRAESGECAKENGSCGRVPANGCGVRRSCPRANSGANACPRRMACGGARMSCCR